MYGLQQSRIATVGVAHLGGAHFFFFLLLLFFSRSTSSVVNHGQGQDLG